MEVAMLAWALLLAVLSPSDGANLTLAVILPRHNTTYPWSWPRVGPAIERAIQELNARPDLLAGYTVQLVFGNSEDSRGICLDSMASLAAVDLKMAHSPHAFVGPGCIYATAPVARFSSHWDLPLVTGASEAYGFVQKEGEYALVTRTGGSHSKVGEFGVNLSWHFNWSSRAMLLYWEDKAIYRPCFFTVEGLYMQLPSVQNMTVVDVPFMSTNYTDLLQYIKQKARSKFSTGLGIILPCLTSGKEEEDNDNKTGPFSFMELGSRGSTRWVLRGTLAQGWGASREGGAPCSAEGGTSEVLPLGSFLGPTSQA
ncbi:putative Guanylate cyclase protein [Naja naja]|nr:putative Guanylate cyclase protein [Naja naja]